MRSTGILDPQGSWIVKNSDLAGTWQPKSWLNVNIQEPLLHSRSPKSVGSVAAPKEASTTPITTATTSNAFDALCSQEETEIASHLGSKPK